MQQYSIWVKGCHCLFFILPRRSTAEVEKINYISISYSLSNICTINYQNRFLYVGVIVRQSRPSNFFGTQCRSKGVQRSLTESFESAEISKQNEVDGHRSAQIDGPPRVCLRLWTCTTAGHEEVRTIAVVSQKRRVHLTVQCIYAGLVSRLVQCRVAYFFLAHRLT